MKFLCRLALQLGRPLAEVLDLSAAELAVWGWFHDEYGFPHERAEIGRAMAGAYVGAVWGGKAKPADLLPKMRGGKSRDDLAGVKAWFLARAKKDGE